MSSGGSTKRPISLRANDGDDGALGALLQDARRHATRIRSLQAQEQGLDDELKRLAAVSALYHGLQVDPFDPMSSLDGTCPFEVRIEPVFLPKASQGMARVEPFLRCHVQRTQLQALTSFQDDISVHVFIEPLLDAAANSWILEHTARLGSVQSKAGWMWDFPLDWAWSLLPIKVSVSLLIILPDAQTMAPVPIPTAVTVLDVLHYASVTEVELDRGGDAYIHSLTSGEKSLFRSDPSKASIPLNLSNSMAARLWSILFADSTVGNAALHVTDPGRVTVFCPVLGSHLSSQVTLVLAAVDVAESKSLPVVEERNALRKFCLTIYAPREPDVLLIKHAVLRRIVDLLPDVPPHIALLDHDCALLSLINTSAGSLSAAGDEQSFDLQQSAGAPSLPEMNGREVLGLLEILADQLCLK